MVDFSASAPLNDLLSKEKQSEVAERMILTWGDNAKGQCLFDPASDLVLAPRIVPCRRSMRTLAAGWDRSLLVDTAGALWGGGANREHCLSDESEEPSLPLSRLDIDELDGVPFEAVQLGRDHSLAVLEGGRAVVSWGSSNEFGQAGNGAPLSGCARPGVVHLSGAAVRQVACGEYHSLVLTVQGEVFAFGSNSLGELGVGKREIVVPQAKKVGTNHLRGMPVRAVAAGARSSMALSIGGQVFCWGCNRRGRLGLGPLADQEEVVPLPSAVPYLPGMARAIAAGAQHSAVILRRGRLFLAGDNRSGQLGQPRVDFQSSSTFLELPARDHTFRVRTVALGSIHTLILSYDGELYACGQDAAGRALVVGGTSLSRHHHADPSPCDELPARLEHPRDCIIIGLASCHRHAVVLALSVPETHERAEPASVPARPQTSAGRVMRSQSAAGERPVDFSQTMGPCGFGGAKLSQELQTIREDTALASSVGFSPGPRPTTSGGLGSGNSLSSGCTSRLSTSSHKVAVPLSPKVSDWRGSRKGGLLGAGMGSATGAGDEGEETLSPRDEGPGRAFGEDIVLLQPVVQPGMVSSVGFEGLSVATLASLVRDVSEAQGESIAGESACASLRAALSSALATPCLLNASFCFPGLYRPRLDSGGLLKVYTDLANRPDIMSRIETQVTSAAFEGLSNWASDHEEASSLIHRDQLRGLPALLLSPVMANPQKTQPYELMSRAMRLVAWMPPEGRRELQEVVCEECSEEEVLRCLVRRVREHCDETVRRAHQMQRLSPEIWEGLMLLQLLWGANEAVAKRLNQSLQTQQSDHELHQTRTRLSGTLRMTSTGKVDNFGLAPAVPQPVPAADFHLQSLAEELVPPELEFRLFVENACAGPITPKEVLDVPLHAARTDYGYEYVLPSKVRSFMANRNLVPVSYTRKVLQVENHHAQIYLQHQVARRVAADLEVLPGHEIHIDPALLFFILKVRRDHILEDTAAALQRATPEDLRRQLKVVFEGEQGVDEGGLAREFFRLLSMRVFAADCGLFDPEVAKSARVLWFDKGSRCESKDFWLAGVILGLVVYNNLPGLDVRLPSVVFKKIKEEPVGLEDLRMVHPDTYVSLRSLLQWEPEPGTGRAEANEVFECTFCLDFTVAMEISGATMIRELCRGGSERAVNLDNREEFVRLYSDWLLNSSVEQQFEPFRKGVRRVCDSPLFNALDGTELELIACGEQDLNFAHLQHGAHYEGYTDGTPYVDCLWRVLLSLDSAGKKRFLSFVTGSDLAPVGGLQELQLVIQRNGGEPTERLPTAHTCFNLLLLPEYDSEEKLERMLTTAMHNAEGFGLE